MMLELGITYQIIGTFETGYVYEGFPFICNVQIDLDEEKERFFKDREYPEKSKSGLFAQHFYNTFLMNGYITLLKPKKIHI